MIYRICILLSLFQANIVTGQLFAPTGTVWNHCLQPDIEPGQLSIVSVASDTAFRQGMPCIVVRSADFGKIGQTTLDSVLICGDGDRYYYAEGDSLHLLYDFSLQAGQILTLRFPVEMNTYYQEWFSNASLFWHYLIVATDTVVIDGIPLRRQQIAYESDPYFNVDPGEWAIERIGYEQWIFPFMNVGEGNAYCYLTEYLDDQVHHIDTIHPCMILSRRDDIPVNKIEIWPNPTTGPFHLSAEDGSVPSGAVFDIHGRRIAYFNNGSFDLSDRPSGLYIVHMTTADRILVGKLMKE